MALTIDSVGTAGSTASGPSLAVTGITAAVDTMLALAIGADNAAGSGGSSIAAPSDSAGNTWTKRGPTVNNSPGAVAGDGTTLEIWTCLVTTALASGTVTVPFAPDTGSKVAAIKRATASAGKIPVVHSVGAGWTGTGSTPSTGTIAAVPSAHTLLGWVANESGNSGSDDADTTNGAWSAGQGVTASTGTANTSQALRGQHKAVSATGDQSFDPTLSGSRDWAINWLILHEQVSLSGAITDDDDTAAGTTVLRHPLAAAIVDADDVAAGSAVLRHVVSAAVVDADDAVAGSAILVIAPADIDEALLEAYAIAPAHEVIYDTMELRHPLFRNEAGELTSIFVTTNKKDIQVTLEDDAPVMGGEAVTCISLPFTYSIPPVEPGTTPELQIAIDNVDDLIVENLDRAAQSAEKILLVYRPYLASDTSFPRHNPPRVVELSEVLVEDLRVTARARTAINLLGPFPRESYTAEKHPGLIGR